MIAYAGLRAARTAKDLYAKLIAAGITSVILIQATVNFFAVLGLLPLTGVPLPFISYGNSNLIVLLAGMGLLINVAQNGCGAKPHRRRSWQARRVKGAGIGCSTAEELAPRSSVDRATGSSRAAKQGAPAKRRSARPGRASRRRALQASRYKEAVDAKDRDRSRRDGRARRAGARDRRRAAG